MSSESKVFKIQNLFSFFFLFIGVEQCCNVCVQIYTFMCLSVMPRRAYTLVFLGNSFYGSRFCHITSHEYLAFHTNSVNENLVPLPLSRSGCPTCIRSHQSEGETMPHCYLVRMFLIVTELGHFSCIFSCLRKHLGFLNHRLLPIVR